MTTPLPHTSGNPAGRASAVAVPPAAALASASTFRGWHLAVGRERMERATRDFGRTTLDEAAQLMARLSKSPFLIEETTILGNRALHSFVSKARRVWRYDPAKCYKIRVDERYPVLTGSMAVEAFEPRRPFDAFRDSAADGRQPHDPVVIEVAA